MEMQLNEHTGRTVKRPHNDNGGPVPATRLVDDLRMGLRFYSRLPTGDAPHETPNLNRIALALPFASLVIGLAPVAVLGAAWLLGVPPYFAAALAVAASVIATGAMAEDAIADTADGLFGGATVERRLEIMKDSRHGTYGVAALSLFLLLRVIAVGSTPNVLAAAGIWLAAMLIARSGALWLTAALPAARSGGASADAGRVSKQAFGIGAIFVVVLSFVLAAPAVTVAGLLLALAVAVGTVFGWIWVCRKLIGGQTGDLIGALQALIEIAVLTVFMIFV